MRQACERCRRCRGGWFASLRLPFARRGRRGLVRIKSDPNYPESDYFDFSYKCSSPISLLIATLLLAFWRPIMADLAAALPISGANYAYLCVNSCSRKYAQLRPELIYSSPAQTECINFSSVRAHRSSRHPPRRHRDFGGRSRNCIRLHLRSVSRHRGRELDDCRPARRHRHRWPDRRARVSRRHLGHTGPACKKRPLAE
jgi:hypothetical protein